ncbi:glycosyltransferase [Lysobacter sp. A6]|uniref:Glycosyltransferase n=1 Tax=Noviluteimonas lactosilytica TaxID=2888523 RepID=A0ABS8JG68_9GAMM|nr:glycosyltransferase [Lysobacter lactosilyticus]MCC8362601.1 glycosyltransferase [Lysobacter lactosilyticus]
MSRKIRVGVSGHDLKFWYPLQRALEKTGKYEFREDAWTGHDAHDPAQSQALLEWADILVAEWALGNAVYYARHKRPHQRLIVRLHQQERRTAFPGQIDYSKVERVLFVGAHILHDCVEKFAIPPEICSVLANFVDVDRYNLPKHGGAEFTLGLIGTAPSSKRLDLAIDTLELLARRDDRYCLRVKGANPATIPWLWARTAERDYYMQVYARINAGPLRHRVIFDPQGNDVHHWLQMIGAILSPSDHESFHMALSEGAASGAVPVLWAREGAQDIYPEFPLVRDAGEAAALIEFHNRSAAGARVRQQAKDIIRSRYDTSEIVGEWDRLLSGGGDAQAQPAKSGKRRDVLVVWAIDKWRNFHRREMLEALAANVADRFDVLVIEPGSHYATIAKLGWAPASELKRMAAGELVHEHDNIFRTRLFTGGMPPEVASAKYQGKGDDPLAVLDGLVAEHWRGARVLHWVYKPDQALRLGDKRRYVYEVYDDYTMDFGTGEVHRATLDAEPKALAQAEHVFFTSQPLFDRKAASARAASLVGNGVAFDTFARYHLGNHRVPGRPVAGYLGNLSNFFDWALVLEVCRRMPEVDFVLHGQVELAEGDTRWELQRQLAGLDNVRFTARVGRELGAAAINRYDVLLIPFVVNEAMHAVNPLKLWEYFATGRPVVSTPMDAITEQAPALIVADGPDAWVDAIHQALGEDFTGEQAVAARIERAQANSWHHLTSNHAATLRALT